MATPTAPTIGAPVPAPETAAAPASPAGPLASILAPVEPARPVKPIGSTASMAEEPAGTAPVVEKPAKQGEGAAGREHPVGALVRAIAARIGRGGNASTVKRQHTITETRVSGNSTNTNNANRASRDAKQHHMQQHQTARDAKLADLNNKMRQQHGRTNRDAKSSDSRDSKTANSNSAAAKKDAASRTTQDAKTAESGIVHQTHRDGLDPKPTRDPLAKKDTSSGTGRDTQQAKATDSQGATKVDLAKTPKADAKPTNGSTPAADAHRPRTQSSREAGYRDGTRAGAVVGHAKAYRDGVQDGYTDRTAADQAEKRRMDDAKAKNARRPDTPAKPAMAPTSGSTVDLAKKDKPKTQTAAAPAQNVGVNEGTITFDASGVHRSMSRGEVRTLKAFERRMEAKVPVLEHVAEGSKDARATAVEHAQRARDLADAARDVRGGAHLVAKLLRLAESAHQLRTKTEDIEKAAHRGTEALRVLVANANTRHGGIYRAVANSPLTKPAEREFYQDTEGS